MPLAERSGAGFSGSTGGFDFRGALSGIGFTMSLFIAGLAFQGQLLVQLMKLIQPLL